MLAGCGDLPVRPQATPTTLPHDDASFDLVTAVCVFHHVPVPDRPALAGELARILRPGGIAAIVEHNPLNPVTQLVVWQTPVDVDAVLLGARASRRLLAGAALVPQATRYLLYFPAGIHRRAPGLERALRHLPGGGQYAVFARRRS
jgi:SAM-dependent methyltransferase